MLKFFCIQLGNITTISKIYKNDELIFDSENGRIHLSSNPDVVKELKKHAHEVGIKSVEYFSPIKFSDSLNSIVEEDMYQYIIVEENRDKVRIRFFYNNVSNSKYLN